MQRRVWALWVEAFRLPKFPPFYASSVPAAGEASWWSFLGSEAAGGAALARPQPSPPVSGGGDLGDSSGASTR